VIHDVNAIEVAVCLPDGEQLGTLTVYLLVPIPLTAAQVVWRSAAAPWLDLSAHASSGAGVFAMPVHKVGGFGPVTVLHTPDVITPPIEAVYGAPAVGLAPVIEGGKPLARPAEETSAIAKSGFYQSWGSK
jgi:hypothetical protein